VAPGGGGGGGGQGADGFPRGEVEGIRDDWRSRFFLRFKGALKLLISLNERRNQRGGKGGRARTLKRDKPRKGEVKKAWKNSAAKNFVGSQRRKV